MDAPSVQYVTTSDGYNVAYTVSGQGAPFVLMPHNFNHVQLNWKIGGLGTWLEALTKTFRLVHYDSRGLGLSSRNLGADHTPEAYVRDLTAVVDHLELDSFVLLGSGSRFGHAAVRYTVDNPARVRALILCAASGQNATDSSSGAYARLAHQNWPRFLASQIPDVVSDAERAGALERMRQATTQLDYELSDRVCSTSTIEELLPRLQTPTLLLHPREFLFHPVDATTRLASKIRNSQFVLIDGGFPVVFGDAETGVRAVNSFLNSISVTMPRNPPGLLSPREVEVLGFIAAGKSNAQIAKELVISPSTVLHHVTNILTKTGSANRTEAAMYAARNGLA